MQATFKKIRVLVVEDELVVSADLQQRLALLGFEVVGAADTGAEAVALAETLRPDVALMDIMLHGKPEGIDAAGELRDNLNIPVIYLTAHSDTATLQKAKLTDPSGYIVKPFEDSQLRVAIELAPARHIMEQRARQVARWLSATLTSVGDAVIATNTRSEILLLNPAAEKLTGWTQDAALGKPCAEVVRLINHRTGALVQDPATRALRSGIVVRLDPDTMLIARDGEERFVDDSASPITDDAGKTMGAVVVLVDATDRVTARSRVEALTRQVADLMAERDKHEMVSAELEAFAAAVSHDLRGPLAAISGFSYLLAERHRERLDTSGQKFLDYVRTNALQMERMVEDYLAFLKTNRTNVAQPVALDLKAMALAEFATLSCRPGGNPSELVCGELPQAWGDAAMVRQVLTNLLGNALKYSSRRTCSVVELGAVPGAGFHTFFVRDNGVGFDVVNAQKLFEPFHRFHSVADFPGTGVGLAIVKRIIEKHGGRVWAESRPDAGASFFFTLPAQAPTASQPA